MKPGLPRNQETGTGRRARAARRRTTPLPPVGSRRPARRHAALGAAPRAPLARCRYGLLACDVFRPVVVFFVFVFFFLFSGTSLFATLRAPGAWRAPCLLPRGRAASPRACLPLPFLLRLSSFAADHCVLYSSWSWPPYKKKKNKKKTKSMVRAASGGAARCAGGRSWRQ